MRNLSKNDTSYFRSPKRKLTVNGSAPWYNYYAGYSELFVQDVLGFMKLKPNSLVLDPWNGSGTTTFVAEKEGFNAIGFDINPVMSIVANARRYCDCDSIIKTSKKILTQANRYRKTFIPSKDPLLTWLSDDSVTIIRRIERAIQNEMLHQRKYSYAKDPCILKKLITEPNVAFFYVALFRTITELLKSFKGSNPTWIKKPSSDSEKIELSEDIIYRSFNEQVNFMITLVVQEKTKARKIMFDIVPSQKLPLDDNTIDAIITSPPYCTRIDYVIATRLELAILGIGNDEAFEHLRSSMIGTIKINKEDLTESDMWGQTAIKFLESVKNHYSKASKTYYLKQFIQYFHSIFCSFSELTRVLKHKGYATIVVQDSYYKDIHLDLPRVFIEMGNNLGWYLVHDESFFLPQTMATINKSSAKYRTSTSAVEHALVFRKDG